MAIGIFYGNPGGLSMDERLSRDEFEILRKMGRDKPEDIEAYLAQRGKNREKAQREMDAEAIPPAKKAATPYVGPAHQRSPFPNQPDGSMSDPGRMAEGLNATELKI